MDDLLSLAASPRGSRWAGRPIHIVASTGSTNDDARSAAQAGAPQGYTVVADTQHGGRGRRGRSWHSPPGENLYVSIVVRPKLAPTLASLLALASGLAVADAVGTFVPPDRVTLKWPNDVRIDGRKVAGVLVEGALRGVDLAFAVVGIGVNVRTDPMPAELAPIATSLRGALGHDVGRERVLEHLLLALERRVDALVDHGPEATVEAVRACCDTLGTRVRIDDVEGTAVDVGLDGALIVRRDDGSECICRAGDLQTVARLPSALR